MIALLVQAVIVLAIAGLLLWAIEQFPLDATIKQLIRVVVIVIVCLILLVWLSRMFGGVGVF